jgi:hypothetical protein
MTLGASPMRFDLFIGKKFARRAKLPAARLAPEGATAGFMQVVDGDAEPLHDARVNLATAPLAVQLALYETAMDDTRALLARELGVSTTILSEMSTIPFPCSVPEPSEP